MEIEEILLLTDEEIKKDISQGVRKSQIIQKYQKLTNYIINVFNLDKIGIQAETIYSENDIRSFIKIHILNIDANEVRNYFKS